MKETWIPRKPVSQLLHMHIPPATLTIHMSLISVDNKGTYAAGSPRLRPSEGGITNLRIIRVRYWGQKDYGGKM